MLYRNLGNTGFIVSRLCLGTLTIGPLQLGLSLQDGARLIRAARDNGVNFFDTAHIYGTYPYIRRALGTHETDVVIASRSYAYSAKTMQSDLEHALRETGRERIEVFGLHEQESPLTLRGHMEALLYLCRAKEQGKVGAVSVSTHFVSVVRAAAKMPEVDVIHPLINVLGIGIRDGSADDMRLAVEEARRAGKGIYAMKALAGGHLCGSAMAALAYVRDIDAIDSVAVGAVSEAEIAFNACILSGELPKEGVVEQIAKQKRRLVIQDWCTGCGQCAARCPSGALKISAGKAVVDEQKCLFCGYCAHVCEGFCIKVV